MTTNYSDEAGVPRFRIVDVEQQRPQQKKRRKRKHPERSGTGAPEPAPSVDRWTVAIGAKQGAEALRELARRVRDASGSCGRALDPTMALIVQDAEVEASRLLSLFNQAADIRHS